MIGDQMWFRGGSSGPWGPTSIAALFDGDLADSTSLDPDLFDLDLELGE